MMRLGGAFFVTFSLLFAGLPIACGSTSSSGPSEEAGVEGGQDGTGGEVGEDAPFEVGVDSSFDGADATVDGPVGSEGGPDAPAEGDADVAAEVGPDARADVGADVVGDVAGDVSADVLTDVGADVSGDVVPDVAGDVAGQGEADDGGAEASEGGCSLSSTADAGSGGTLNWTENFGTTGQTTPAAVSIDPASGDVVVVGYLGGTINFGGGLLTSHGDASTSGPDAFVARFDSSGHYKWAKDFGNALAIYASGVAFGGSGSVTVGGTFEGSLNLGCGTLTAAGTDDLFLATFDASGTCTWSKRFGAAGQLENITSVAVDRSGNVLIGGVAYGSVDLGGGTRTGYYIAKFDSTGAYVWSNAFAASSTASSPMLIVDGQGNMILAGSFASTVNFGAGTLTSAGSTDVFIAKFDPSGTYQWAKQYGDSSEQNPTGVAVDRCGNIVVVGDLSGTINFGSGTLTAAGANSYLFLAKISPAGDGIWSEEFVGSPGALTSGSVAVDPAGRTTITASINSGGTANLGGGSLSSPSPSQGIAFAIASFEATGAYRWSYAGGPPSTTTDSFGANPIAVAAGSASVVAVGGFVPSGGTLVLDGRTLTAASAQDLFLANFAP